MSSLTPKYKNKARCKVCSTVIESRYSHQLVHCKCKMIFVDGGYYYWKEGGPRNAFERIYEDIHPPKVQPEEPKKEDDQDINIFGDM